MDTLKEFWVLITTGAPICSSHTYCPLPKCHHFSLPAGYAMPGHSSHAATPSRHTRTTHWPVHPLAWTSPWWPFQKWFWPRKCKAGKIKGKAGMKEPTLSASFPLEILRCVVVHAFPSSAKCWATSLGPFLEPQLPHKIQSHLHPMAAVMDACCNPEFNPLHCEFNQPAKKRKGKTFRKARKQWCLPPPPKCMHSHLLSVRWPHRTWQKQPTRSASFQWL